jgi:hypothetical protein
MKSRLTIARACAPILLSSRLVALQANTWPSIQTRRKSAQKIAMRHNCNTASVPKAYCRRICKDALNQSQPLADLRFPLRNMPSASPALPTKIADTLMECHDQ